MDYCPNRWIFVRLTSSSGSQYKVFATWFGSYTNGDCWRLSSGVVKVSLDGDFYVFNNYSGSNYHCHKDSYGTSVYTDGVLFDIRESYRKNNVEFELVPDDFDFLNLEIENGCKR